MKINKINQIASLLPKNPIARSLHRDLWRHLFKPEVSVLYGARRVGKSSEIYFCIKEILKQEKGSDIFYFNLDFPSRDFENPDRLRDSVIAQKKTAKSKTYIFIDEAQRIENAGLFVKYLFDQKLNFKFVLTGSASLDIMQKTKEYLTGRKKEFFLPSLMLDEIIAWRGINIDNIRGSFEQLENILTEYLIFGGYTAVVAAASWDKKKEIITEIADSYLSRDIKEIFHLDRIQATRLIASVLGENIGGLTSIENIGKLTGLVRPEILKNLEALQKTFVIWQMTPFYRRRDKELVHQPKIYYCDLGVRNAILQKIDEVLLLSEKGKLFENAIAISLINIYGLNSVKYWRTINQTEIDFIVQKSFSELYAFETKFFWEKGKIAKNIESFKAAYRDMVRQAKVISRDNFWQIFKR